RWPDVQSKARWTSTPDLFRSASARALGLSAAQLRVYTAAYLANETMCSIAAHTLAGQDFGKRRFVVEFNMLAPGMTETSITSAFVSCYGRFSGPDNALDHFTTHRLQHKPARRHC